MFLDAKNYFDICLGLKRAFVSIKRLYASSGERLDIISNVTILFHSKNGVGV